MWIENKGSTLENYEPKFGVNFQSWHPWSHNFGKPAYLSMPKFKFLAGCHHNEEEISRHLKNSIGYWPVQINDNKFATSQILRKPVEVVKGRILAGWAQKSPETWCKQPFKCTQCMSFLFN